MKRLFGIVLIVIFLVLLGRDSYAVVMYEQTPVSGSVSVCCTKCTDGSDTVKYTFIIDESDKSYFENISQNWDKADFSIIINDGSGNPTIKKPEKCEKYDKVRSVQCTVDIGDMLDADGLKSNFQGDQNTLTMRMQVPVSEIKYVGYVHSEPFKASDIKLNCVLFNIATLMKPISGLINLPPGALKPGYSILLDPKVIDGLIAGICLKDPDAPLCKGKDEGEVDCDEDSTQDECDPDGDKIMNRDDLCDDEAELYDIDGVTPLDNRLDGCPESGSTVASTDDPADSPAPQQNVMSDGGACSFNHGSGSNSFGFLVILMIVAPLLAGRYVYRRVLIRKKRDNYSSYRHR